MLTTAWAGLGRRRTEWAGLGWDGDGVKSLMSEGDECLMSERDE